MSSKELLFFIEVIIERVLLSHTLFSQIMKQNNWNSLIFPTLQIHILALLCYAVTLRYQWQLCVLVHSFYISFSTTTKPFCGYFRFFPRVVTFWWPHNDGFIRWVAPPTLGSHLMYQFKNVKQYIEPICFDRLCFGFICKTQKVTFWRASWSLFSMQSRWMRTST